MDENAVTPGGEAWFFRFRSAEGRSPKRQRLAA